MDNEDFHRQSDEGGVWDDENQEFVDYEEPMTLEEFHRQSDEGGVYDDEEQEFI